MKVEIKLIGIYGLNITEIGKNFIHIPKWNHLDKPGQDDVQPGGNDSVRPGRTKIKKLLKKIIEMCTKFINSIDNKNYDIIPTQFLESKQILTIKNFRGLPIIADKAPNTNRSMMFHNPKAMPIEQTKMYYAYPYTWDSLIPIKNLQKEINKISWQGFKYYHIVYGRESRRDIAKGVVDNEHYFEINVQNIIGKIYRLKILPPPVFDIPTSTVSGDKKNVTIEGDMGYISVNIYYRSNLKITSKNDLNTAFNNYPWSLSRKNRDNIKAKLKNIPDDKPVFYTLKFNGLKFLNIDDKGETTLNNNSIIFGFPIFHKGFEKQWYLLKNSNRP